MIISICSLAFESLALPLDLLLALRGALEVPPLLLALPLEEFLESDVNANIFLMALLTSSKSPHIRMVSSLSSEGGMNIWTLMITISNKIHKFHTIYLVSPIMSLRFFPPFPIINLCNGLAI
jgi:hypothetical protein